MQPAAHIVFMKEEDDNVIESECPLRIRNQVKYLWKSDTDTYDVMVDSGHTDVILRHMNLRVTRISCTHLFRLLSLMLNSASRHDMATSEGQW